MHTRSKLSKVTTLKRNEENVGLIFVFLKQEKQMHNVLHFVCETTFWALSFEKQIPENSYIKWKYMWKKKRWKGLLFHDLVRVVFPPELLLSHPIIYYWQEIITEFEIVIHERSRSTIKILCYMQVWQLHMCRLTVEKSSIFRILVKYSLFF